MKGGPRKLLNNRAPQHPGVTISRINRTPQGSPLYPFLRQRIRIHRYGLSLKPGSRRVQSQILQPGQADGPHFVNAATFRASGTEFRSRAGWFRAERKRSMPAHRSWSRPSLVRQEYVLVSRQANDDYSVA